LYLQDQWTVGSRLTLNLGLRTENENVPTFRPDYQKNAFTFSFADKLAPRLGAAYDIKGDGRLKVFGSWGLYYDWTKYDLARGSFGAETWCVNYRGLDTLDLNSLNLSHMPGQDLWVTPGTCRDRRVPSFAESIQPDIKRMKQSSISGGTEYQLNRNSVLTFHYIHNDLLETIEDVGFLTPQGDEGYLIANPGVGLTALQFPTGATPPGQPTPRPKRVYDAFELGYNRRFSGNYFFSANYTLSRLYGNYSGLASSDEITTPTTGGSSSAAQQQAGSISRPGGNVNRFWDLDELLWDSHGNLGLEGRLATDRPRRRSRARRASPPSRSFPTTTRGRAATVCRFRKRAGSSVTTRSRAVSSRIPPISPGRSSRATTAPRRRPCRTRSPRSWPSPAGSRRSTSSSRRSPRTAAALLPPRRPRPAGKPRRPRPRWRPPRPRRRPIRSSRRSC